MLFFFFSFFKEFSLYLTYNRIFIQPLTAYTSLARFQTLILHTMDFLYSQFFIHPKYPTESFSGKTVIVTGSNVGLGKEAARHFTRLDAEKVILAVRNLTSGHEAKEDIEKSTGRHGVCEVWHLDLASFASVKAFATRVSTDLARLDIVVENAGISTKKFVLAEGHERTITVNVVSTFLLALLLLPKLKEMASTKNTSPRLSIVASEVHGWTNFAEWKEENTFGALSDEPVGAKAMAERYRTSKLLEVLVVRELAPRLASSGVTLNMLNPGFCHSEILRDEGWFAYLMKLILARSTEEGSRTLVAAAAAGKESHGAYMTDGVVKNDALSGFVRSEDGQKAQKKVWSELAAILEHIQPGVTLGFA